MGIIGSQFVSELHAEVFKLVKGAEIIAGASPTKSHVESFAKRFGIPKHFNG